MSATGPTPETDAAIKAAIQNEDEDHERLAAVARKLERQRDSAKDLNRELLDKLEAMEAERDAAREQLRQLQASLCTFAKVAEGERAAEDASGQSDNQTRRQ